VLSSGPVAVALVVLVAAVTSALITGTARRLALEHAVLDIPNPRSSHAAPTPRGGGISIAAVALLAIAGAGLAGWLPFNATVGLLGGSLLVAAVGWLDDIRGLPTWLRAVTQVVAGVWFLAWTGGLPTLRVADAVLSLGPVGAALALIAIVWGTNLYNFMDGIDGIAGGQGVVTAALATVLLAVSVPGLGIVSAAVAGASLGFLVWNWAPARVFMGDVGSCLLGFLFTTVALLSERSGGPSFLAWTLLVAVFVFDATVTLFRRLLRRERWYAAHRSHAYQRAVQSGWTHAQVSAGVMILSLLLGLLGVAVTLRPALLLPAGLAALVILTAIYLWIERRCPMRKAADRP